MFVDQWNNEILAPNGGTVFSTIATGIDNQDNYLEIKRDGDTVTASIFSDSNYTILVESQTITTSSNVRNLRYIKVLNYEQNAGGSVGITGYFDDMELWNGI